MVTGASTIRIVSHQTNTKEKREKRKEQAVTQELPHVHQQHPWVCGPAVSLHIGASLEAALADSQLESCSKGVFPRASFLVFSRHSRCVL